MKLLPALLLATLPLSAAESLFDGKTLSHWSGKAEHWRVEDGAITGEIPADQPLKGNEWIFWDGEVHDFDLTVEFRITGGPSANSATATRSHAIVVPCIAYPCGSTLPVSPGVSFTDTTVARGKKLNSLAEAQV